MMRESSNPEKQAVEFRDLGIMNAWTSIPKEFTHHEENCGAEVEYKYLLGVPGTYEMRKKRVPNVVFTERGTFSTHYCHDCGCKWSIDSSD